MLTDLPIRTIDYKQYGDLILSPRDIVNFKPLSQPLGPYLDDGYLLDAIRNWVSGIVPQVSSEMTVAFAPKWDPNDGSLESVKAIITSTDPTILGVMFGLSDGVEALTIEYGIKAMVAVSAGYTCHDANHTEKFWFKIGANL